MSEEDVVEVRQCPTITELDEADGKNIPWPYIYLGFLIFKATIAEIGLIH